VCTFSALVIKSTTAHIFQVGDTRIYRLRANNLEQLTEDHRLWLAQDQSYLSRALGINSRVEIDYRALAVEVGDIFLLATDGAYETLSARNFIDTLSQATDLQAFHRLQMLHQDLRPENIMIDASNTVKIIDFGSTQVAGLLEMAGAQSPQPILGSEQYAAPEYFLGEHGSARSDLFSLGVITYQLLTGQLPYGAQVPRAHPPAAQRRLHYISAAAPHGQSRLGSTRPSPRPGTPIPTSATPNCRSLFTTCTSPTSVSQQDPPALIGTQPSGVLARPLTAAGGGLDRRTPPLMRRRKISQQPKYTTRRLS
jgi:serine/threonine protein kinase